VPPQASHLISPSRIVRSLSFILDSFYRLAAVFCYRQPNGLVAESGTFAKPAA
jgi:hypothetical protein